MILYYLAQKSTGSLAALSKPQKAFSIACAAMMCPALADAMRAS